MKFKQHRLALPVKNYDFNAASSNYGFEKHGELLKGGCKRGLIIGSSGSGKTNVMIALLENPNGLRFTNLYVYSKTLGQPKYEYLRNLLKPLKKIGYYEYENGEDVIPPTAVKPWSVVIFDDVVCDKQGPMREYFCFGRHKNIDTFYLSQTYSSIPKQLIRDNANFLVIFKLDHTNLKHIYDDFVSVDMSLERFRQMCTICWEKPFGFLVIDKDSNLNNGRYRDGFDTFITI